MENRELTLEDVFAAHPLLSSVEVRPEDNRREIKSYVLRGQKMHQYQLKSLIEDYDRYYLPYSDTPVDWTSVFGNNNPVIIEIGFGMGESTLRIAKQFPQYNFIGIEVFLYGFSKLMHNCAKEGLTNIKLMRFDAKQVLTSMVAPSSVYGFHVFFPDPWQKKRNNKRRLIQLPFTQLMASKLCKGGYIYCVTDWEEYAAQMLDVLSSCDLLENRFDGFAEPVAWRPTTGFEKKGLDKDHPINEVWFERI